MSSPPQKDILVPPFGKLSYLVSQEHQILPQLSEAVKAYNHVTGMDGELREKFEAMDKFSKTVPPLEAVKQEFLKVDAAVKLEAQSLQDLEVVVKTIKSLLSQIGKAAEAAHRNLLITEDDLKAASDLQKARALRAKLDMGPLGGLMKNANKAVLAWEKVEVDPIGFIGAALDATDSLIKVLGLDTLNQQIGKLEEEASQLAWKSAIAKFKLAKQELSNLKEAGTNLAEPFKKAKEQYASRKKNLPLDFDAYNKKGKFQFKSMTDLAAMLKTYHDLAQQAVTEAHHASEKVYKIQGLGTPWMANASQDKDIVAKMFTVTKRVMERAMHERDGADTRVKIIHKQIDELEVILSKMRLKPN